ncbi:peroxisomal targeting signal 2 receptor [Diaporthe amygdali]|uniref:peroxisomal targeting signal 2 receptor n=1 Tax=Phomopsis amygdali TaxID=1214568 RepID=UPI0022FE8B3C|nr:peroxisomal targeting signal 2 receptor [Diaporthe amygdali]KAJ0118072.1 peroxisomal targeting signal 2 receptor [Diaporthe amygdali]
MAAMLEFRTRGFNPYAVKYSPYYDNRVAVASAANFGIVGNGRLFALGLTAAGIQVEKTFDTNDALYDLAWSEINENQLLAACGDGSIKLFDLGVDTYPVMNYHEHKRETFSVFWNQTTKDTFVSSSWDGTVKIWSPTRPQSLKTLPIGSCTYSVAFSPHNPALISAVSSDSRLRVFDLRTPPSAKYHLVHDVPVHQTPAARISSSAGPGAPAPGPGQPAEVLTHDWNKYSATGVIATAGVDRAIRTFDLRAPYNGPVAVLEGHGYAVRRLAWSPHAADVLVSASYDMSVRVWTDGSTMGPIAPAGDMNAPVRLGVQLGLMNRHTEFATGVDWCLFGAGGWVASAGWDERVLLWDANSLIRR